MLTITIPGTPTPQGSKTGVIRGNRVILLEGSSTTNRTNHAAWRATIAHHARQPTPLTGPLWVETEFHLTRPRSVRREHPSVKPDLDKLIRALLDGLTDAGVWQDDAQVCGITASKKYGATGWTGAVVRVGQFD